MKNICQAFVCFLCFIICSDSVAQVKRISPVPEFYNSIIESAYQSGIHEVKSMPSQLGESTSNEIMSYVEHINFQHDLTTYRSSDAPNVIAMDLSFKGEKISLKFKRKYLTGKDYKLSTSSKNKYPKIEAIYYQGVVEGEHNSWATLAIIDGVYKVLVASKSGNIEVAHEGGYKYSIYNSKDQLKIKDYVCESIDTEIRLDEKTTTQSRMVGSDCVELYVECDYQSYLDNGSSVASTEAWALAVINDVAALYATIDIPLVVSETFVWDSSDPYSDLSNTMAIRDSFVERIQNGYQGRVGQLFSTRDTGGGLAYGLGGLCGSYPDFPGPYSIATSLSSSYASFPNYSFTVNVVAHELGHVFGARHTHACVWGENFDTQIDDCGNVHATNNNETAEGGECYDLYNPLLPSNGGTIMSFCNLAGGGIDLNNGFAEEVGVFIQERYTTATCSTGDLCASIPPSNDACANALEILPRGICNYISYDNIEATPSGVADPSCGDVGIAVDVWFSFVLDSNQGKLGFNPVDGEVEDVVISIYSGTCSSLTEVLCRSVENEEVSFKLNGLIAGETYYVRVIESGSNMTGQFQLCLEDESLPCHPSVQSMVDLYNATNGSAWTNNSGWQGTIQDANCDVCNWYGVTCDNLNNVIGIDLYNNNLVGSIPQSFEALNFLRTLKLNNNSLSGTFPEIWSMMSDLSFLDLSNNQFTGSMPSTLGDLTKLTTLYIEDNNLTGELLPEIGELSFLNVFWAKNNNIQGCYPDEYSNLCNRGSIRFNNNPLLPSEGNSFENYCDTGAGSDMDKDGFCFGSEVGDDCNDTDNTIYPDAPELCDGKDNNCNDQFDEGLSQTNTWLPSGGGSWTVASNWSLGIIPEGCHDVVFPAANGNRSISIGLTIEAFARSITIADNNSLINTGTLTVSGSDTEGISMDTGSAYVNNGDATIVNASTIGIDVVGILTNNGTIHVNNLSNDIELYVHLNGILINEGVIQVQ